MSTVDALTGLYTVPCPTLGEARMPLSGFRTIDRLSGTAHPVVFRVVFACRCGDEHTALVSHAQLDWAPLGMDATSSFHNLMTSRADDLASELAAIATARIRRGEWPWSFFCSREGRPRPVCPSAFRLLAPAAGEGMGVVVACPVCGSVSVNLVTRPHVDVPFRSDERIGVPVRHFDPNAVSTIDAFSAQLASTSFDEKRLLLDP